MDELSAPVQEGKKTLSKKSKQVTDESHHEGFPNWPNPYSAEKSPPVTTYGTKERQFRGAIAENNK